MAELSNVHTELVFESELCDNFAGAGQPHRAVHGADGWGFMPNWRVCRETLNRGVLGHEVCGSTEVEAGASL